MTHTETIAEKFIVQLRMLTPQEREAVFETIWREFCCLCFAAGCDSSCAEWSVSEPYSL